MRAKKIALIRATHSRLLRILGREGHHADRYHDVQAREEREHRKGAWGGPRSWAVTVPTVADMMYSRMILAYRCGEWAAPRPEDYFSTRESALMAYALYARNREAIDAAFSVEEARAFCDAMDYAKLVAGDWS